MRKYTFEEYSNYCSQKSNSAYDNLDKSSKKQLPFCLSFDNFLITRAFIQEKRSAVISHSSKILSIKLVSPRADHDCAKVKDRARS